LKHSLQYTGLSCFGSKGTSHSAPQSEHFAGYIFLSPKGLPLPSIYTISFYFFFPAKMAEKYFNWISNSF
jgi:hypothetical protein